MKQRKLKLIAINFCSGIRGSQVQDQLIHLTFGPVFKSSIRLDHPDPDTNFSRLPNPD